MKNSSVDVEIYLARAQRPIASTLWRHPAAYQGEQRGRRRAVVSCYVGARSATVRHAEREPQASRCPRTPSVLRARSGEPHIDAYRSRGFFGASLSVYESTIYISRSPVSLTRRTRSPLARPSPSDGSQRGAVSGSRASAVFAVGCQLVEALRRRARRGVVEHVAALPAQLAQPWRAEVFAQPHRLVAVVGVDERQVHLADHAPQLPVRTRWTPGASASANIGACSPAGTSSASPAAS